MPSILSLKEIRQLCGTTSYQRGEGYYHANRVSQLSYNPDEMCYDAVVVGSKRYDVTVEIDEEYGDVEAECSCPAFHSNYYYCKHIAAVLLKIYHLKGSNLQLVSQGSQRDLSSSSHSQIFYKEMQLTQQLIALFGSSLELPEPSDDFIVGDKQLVDVEFTVKAITYSARKSLFAMEMKVGFKRLYIVQKMKDFLAKAANHSKHVFTKAFTYDPAVHAFRKSDMAILEQLIEAQGNEALYREALNPYYSSSGHTNERQLFISPLIWERLWPLLAETEKAVRFEHGQQGYEQLLITKEPLPLNFQLSLAETNSFRFDIEGLERLTVMDSYGYALHDNKLHALDRSQMQRLTEIKSMFQYTNNKQARISPALIGPFMEQVIPKLKKLGSLRIDQQIADRIVSLPLHIKLYLDRSGERLLAKLQYVYGDLVIEPMRLDAKLQSQTDQIHMRDNEQETRFMSIFERSAFKYNGQELYLEDEEGIYTFLHKILPQLESLSEVFITSSLKSVIHQSLNQPKVTVDLDAKTQWLEVRFDMEGINEQEIRNILRMIVEKKKYYRLPSGAFLSLEEEGFQEISQLMDDMDIRKNEIKSSQLQLPVVRGFHLLDSMDKTSRIKLGKSLRHMLDNMRNPDNLDFELPEQLTPILRDYQKYGFQWMKTLGYYRFGGILADDMGLGKTLQGIAYIQSELKASKEAGQPALIVSPASLTFNWRNEMAKFAPKLKVVIAVGDKLERDGIMQDLTDVDVLITSYPLLRRDMDLYAKQRFHILILDEAQAIKNHATQTAQAVKLIDAQHRFALTGTPVENSLEELWSIYDAVFPTLFPSKKAFSELSREAVARKIKPFLLRRMKIDVLKELPDKIETVQPSELLTEQKKLYMAYLAQLQKETMEQLQTEGLQKSRMKILAGLTRLRQLCCHPALFVDHYAGGSGKLDQLMEIVEECLSGGKRMLIFSQFTSMLGIIRKALVERDLPSFYLDGKTPPSERVGLCDRFNGGENNIFLISLKAGGTGLNLTGADTVVLYDLWWNPAVEQQAADRAHRMGQKQVVQVIRLVTEGTIEEKMYELQQRKKDLINEVIQPGEEALSSLTEKEIRELLMIG